MRITVITNLANVTLMFTESNIDGIDTLNFKKFNVKNMTVDLIFIYFRFTFKKYIFVEASENIFHLFLNLPIC